MAVQPLRLRLAEIVSRWSGTRELSWWSHAAQGFAFTFAGVLLHEAIGLWYYAGFVFNLGAFYHREALAGFLEDWLRDGLRVAWQKATADGLPDFFAPYMAGVLALVVGVLLFGFPGWGL